MALVSTEQLPLGFYAPHFTLPNVLTNKDFSFSGTYGKKGTLIIFMCNHCPYVIHLIEKISELSRIYDALGISFIGINANDIIAYPQDSPLEMVAFAQKYGFDFPYLFDETQSIAKAYNAVCTPDFNLVDSKGKVVYRGRFDEARPGNNSLVSGEDMVNAFERLINGEPQDTNQFPSMGCSIKWKQ